MAIDPRKSATLDDAARNADGTYNGARALSWLSECLFPGKGLPEDEVRRIAEEQKAKTRTRGAG